LQELIKKCEKAKFDTKSTGGETKHAPLNPFVTGKKEKQKSKCIHHVENKDRTNMGLGKRNINDRGASSNPFASASNHRMV
jgi:hypothetical protein